MKRYTKIILAAGVAIVGIGALGSVVVADSKDWRQGSGMYHSNMMGGGYGHGMMGGRYAQGMMGGGYAQGMMGGTGNRFQMMEKKFEMHDLNGDGIVDQKEVDQFRMERHKTYDGNKNGKLELSEFEKLWLESRRDRMVDRFQTFDEDGDGSVTVEEFGSPMARIIERHDRDGDGKIAMKDLGRYGHGWGHGRFYNDDDDDDDRKGKKD